ncbi:hypothetical protein [Breznakiella homolactica]|uniref:Uncharacterized protein n=1 Tax=Breznakiella homolactica TaxID=2798577 RepID=A0A7T8BB55_9SPIR|nr:hypothetical protein [Breznakiella homolactica]QQO09680.1 hypothetical protein JFL75_01815 [Breznakiella homolactica]
MFLDSVKKSIPFTIYLTVLLTLSYSVRRKISAPVTIIAVFALSLGLTAAVFIGGRDISGIPPNQTVTDPKTLGEPGLMLSEGPITMVLLESPAKADGARVVAIPGQPLLYQAVPRGPGNTILPLPAASFSNEAPYFLKSIILDFSLVADNYETLVNQGILHFILYAAAVILLLSSLRFLFEMSVWPLANLFLGALVFRGIVAFETALNSREVRELLTGFTRDRIPSFALGPSILAVFALLIILYTILVHIARGKKADNG